MLRTPVLTNTLLRTKIKDLSPRKRKLALSFLLLQILSAAAEEPECRLSLRATIPHSSPHPPHPDAKDPSWPIRQRLLRRVCWFRRSCHFLGYDRRPETQTGCPHRKTSAPSRAHKRHSDSSAEGQEAFPWCESNSPWCKSGGPHMAGHRFRANIC